MSDRLIPDIRAELERLAQQREAQLGGKPMSRLRGVPMDVAPPSGRGGDIFDNRVEAQG